MANNLKSIITTIRYLFRRTMNVNSNPLEEWPVIATEPSTLRWHLRKTVLPFTILIAASNFIGSFFALSYYNYTIIYILVKTVAAFCECFFTLYVTGLIIKELGPKLKIKLDTDALFKVLIYSFTAWYALCVLAGILSNYPTLGRFLKFLGLYGIVPFWFGMTMIMKVPKENKTRLLLVTLAVAIIVSLLIDWSFESILKPLHISGMINE